MISYDLIKDVFNLDNPLTLEYFELCNVEYDGKGEKHHILPRSVLPEYSKEPWNIANLSYQNHYRAHEILAQICINLVDQKRMLSAWRLLSSTRSGVTIDAEKYAELREISRILHSGSNSEFYMVKRSKEYCYKISEGQKGEKHWMFGRGPKAHPMFGKKHSEKSKMLMSLAKVGIPLSIEHKRRIGLSNSGENNGFYGRKHSEESKKLQSENNFMLGRCGEMHHRYGIKHTEDTKVLMSKARLGKKDSLETIIKRAKSSSVYMYEQYDLRGEFIRVWTSFELNKHEIFNNSHVTSVCLGKRRTHGGFIWKRVLK